MSMPFNIFDQALLDMLYSLDFPCKEQIRRQIESSVVYREFSETLLTVQFDVISTSPKLPSWLNTKTISFELSIPNKETTACFDLFIKDGYVSSFELYYYDYSIIKYEDIISGTVVSDTCYDTNYIIHILTSNRIAVTNFLLVGNDIELYIKSLEDKMPINNRVVFKNCQKPFIRIITAPIKVESVSIRETDENPRSFAVEAQFENDPSTSLSFKCDAFYMYL